VQEQRDMEMVRTLSNSNMFVLKWKYFLDWKNCRQMLSGLVPWLDVGMPLVLWLHPRIGQFIPADNICLISFEISVQLPKMQWMPKQEGIILPWMFFPLNWIAIQN
jgi:hypothetical protein